MTEEWTASNSTNEISVKMLLYTSGYEAKCFNRLNTTQNLTKCFNLTAKEVKQDLLV